MYHVTFQKSACKHAIAAISFSLLTSPLRASEVNHCSTKTSAEVTGKKMGPPEQ